MSKWEYLAGVVDADGTFSTAIRQREFACGVKKTEISLQVTSKKKEYVSWFKENIGGYINHDTENEKGKVRAWKWIVQKKRKMRYILDHIIPHLVLKKKQAKLALEFLKYVKGNTKVYKRWAKRRVELIKKIQELNF